MDKQVALYVRVSTTRQALNDISIPDQIKQAKDYCRKRGWQISSTYIEPGASARSDKRPQFQKMIRDACTDPSPYGIVLVHCLSRFFRDPIDQGLYKRKLEEHGVLLKSITQQFGDGPQADLIQTVKDHNDKLEAQRGELTRLITLKEGNLNLPMRHLSNAQLDRFATTLKDMLHNGPKGFRKEYMKLLVSRVDVGKQNITVTGPKAALAVALKAENSSKERVPSFVRDWCTREDSNL